MRKPFVVIGAPGILTQLKKLGFRTFNEHFSEQYDNIEDNFQRIFLIFDTIAKIKQLSDTQAITDYNYNLLEEYRNDRALRTRTTYS